MATDTGRVTGSREPSSSEADLGPSGFDPARRFTPGPWSAEIHELSEGPVGIVYDRAGHALADYLTEPTAHLIAAAPELYEALAAFVDGDNPNTIDARYEDARQALVKARGEA